MYDVIQRVNEGKGFPIISKGISLKVNVIVQLKFELIYYDVGVQYICHYATETL